MSQPNPNSRKVVNVPFRITSEHIKEALSNSHDIYKSKPKNGRSYSFDHVYDMIQQKFTSLPAYNLFEDAGFFHSVCKPSAFMLENGFAGNLSEIMELSLSEKRKPRFYITEKGVFFLLTVLYRLRDEIDNEIFY